MPDDTPFATETNTRPATGVVATPGVSTGLCRRLPRDWGAPGAVSPGFLGALASDVAIFAPCAASRQADAAVGRDRRTEFALKHGETHTGTTTAKRSAVTAP